MGLAGRGRRLGLVLTVRTIDIEREIELHRRAHTRLGQALAQHVGRGTWSLCWHMRASDWISLVLVALALLPVVLAGLGVIPDFDDLAPAPIAPEISHYDDELVAMPYELPSDRALRHSTE